MSLVSIHNLNFTYPGRYDPVFAHADAQLDTRWKLGLTGRNGRGKTTLLHLLDGSLDAGGTAGKSQGIQRYGQLVNPDLLRTNGAGEEYLIEEAEDPAGQTGCG